MPDSFEQRLATIQQKAALLMQRCIAVARQRDEAFDQIRLLNEQIEQDKKLIQQLSSQVDYLRMASSIENSAGDIQQTRAFLSGLVWEIDKCISQLND